MRIERLDIGGFGRFANVGWDLGPGMTVMLGENEAGKTTLLNALRAILFGFESSRDGRAWYPALAGGRRGGRMALLTAAGERWLVERYGPRGGAGSLAVRAPSGNQGGQETLDRLLHGADRDLFNSIFAFGLGELQNFDSLGGEGVRGRIYGAAAGLGGTSAVEIERRLRQEQEDLFRPSGRLQPINQLFSRMDEVNARIVELSRQPAEFEAANRERADAEAESGRHRQAATALRARAVRLRRLLDASPVAATLDELDAELAGTDPALDDLPVDAVAVLDRRLGAVAQDRARLEALEEQLSEIAVQAAGLGVEEFVLAAGDEIRAVEADRRAHAAGADRLREAAGAHARHAATVAEQLARAGSWDEAHLLALDDSIAAVETTREHERALDGAREAVTAVERRHRSADDELAAREREGASPADMEGDDLDARAALLELARARMRTDPGLPSPTVSVGLFAAPLLLGTALGFAVGQPVIGAVVGLLLAAAVSAVLFLSRGAAGGKDHSALLARAGLAADATEDDIAGRSDALADARARRSVARDQAGGLAARRDEVDRLAEAILLARATLAGTGAAWEAWLCDRGMPSGSSPEVVRQVLGAAGAARRAAEERDAQGAIVASIERERDDLDRRARELLDRLAGGEVGSLDGRLASLVHRLDQSRADRRTAMELEIRRRALVTRRDPLEAAVGTGTASVVEHLATTGCRDADDLRGRDASAVERRAIRQRLRETRAGLAGVAGGPEAVEAFRAELRERDLSAVESELGAAADEADAHELEERRLVARIGELDAHIRALESAEELGTLRQELAGLQARANRLATEWAVRAVTARLLSETRSRYERERQPDVIRAATAHFERITGGRYARIVAPPGDASVRVETEVGEAHATSELSRGTAEQLYLSLRFGLIEEFARLAEPLPVVMDDILVNFDADRADRAAAAIRDLAERHQVLYFTCHRWTAEMLDPDRSRTLTLT